MTVVVEPDEIVTGMAVLAIGWSVSNENSLKDSTFTFHNGLVGRVDHKGEL